MLTKLEEIIPSTNITLGEFLEHCKKNNVPTQNSYFDHNGHVWVYVDSSTSFKVFDYRDKKVKSIRLDFMSTKPNAKLNYIEGEIYNPQINTWVDSTFFKRSWFSGGSLI